MENDRGSAVTAPQRFAVPVNPGKNARPDVWVEGAELCAVADAATERRYLGRPAPAPVGAEPGALWVVGDFLHYVDQGGEERRLPASSWAADFARPHWIKLAPADTTVGELRAEVERLLAPPEED